MFEMDGFEVVELLCDNLFFVEMFIVFMMVLNVDEFSQFKGYSLGVIDYIGKFINEQILLFKVEILLNLYCSKQQFVCVLVQVYQ